MSSVELDLQTVAEQLHLGKPVVHQIEEGDKLFRLTFFPQSHDAYGYIKSIPGKQKVPGATTAIYSRVKEVLIDEANRRGEGITYILSTESPSITAWAKSKGAAIFNWDSIDEAQGLFIATKEITPQSARTT